MGSDFIFSVDEAEEVTDRRKERFANVVSAKTGWVRCVGSVEDG